MEIVSDDSISRQARTYAEYRLFAALSAVGAEHIQSVSLALRRAGSGRRGEGVGCTIAITWTRGHIRRLRAFGAHPYAAINRAAERLEVKAGPVPEQASRRELVISE
jgi:hypothetical protein